jgi:protein-L-isoaspartate(D-aspartate) O-methyltransferase
MFDYATARRMMVDGQVRTADVTDPRLIDAMMETPRERFVPPRKADIAYLDLDLPVGEGASSRRLLKPMVLAKLIQAAEIEGTDRVLDVGCATGYSSAVLSRLAQGVIALEEDAALARQAAEAFAAAALSNVRLVTGPLAAGVPADAPFDAIVMQGATEAAPRVLLGQLRDGGRLVCVEGAGPGAKAMLYRRGGDDTSGRPIFDASAALLPGFAQEKAFVF